MSSDDRWSYKAGKRPYSITVYEHPRSPNVWYRVWVPARDNWKRGSLEHADKDAAIAWADEEAAKLRRGQSDLRAGRVTLEILFAMYLKHRSPEKGKAQQSADKRHAEFWKNVLGPRKDPRKISSAEWKEAKEKRASGQVDARGNEISDKEDQKPVKPRTVKKTCAWLKSVMNWAAEWKTSRGNYLLESNPLRGFDLPEVKDQSRPVATAEDYEALMEVADEIKMEVSWPGKTGQVRSHFAEILAIVNGTGRRISAVCALRYEDLLLERSPHGAIRWRADEDKEEREWVAPINEEVRAAVDRARERPPIGGPLFPAPRDPESPISRHLALKWFNQAEKLAELWEDRERPDRFGYHAFRRKWVMERKHHPDADVAEAGGWKSLQALRMAYQQPDADTMLEVVTDSGDLRRVEGE